MKALKIFALLAVAMLVTVGPVAAQTPKEQNDAVVRTTLSNSAMTLGIAAGLGAGLVIIGAGLGFGKIGSAALESMARQPETANKVQTAMIIIGALLEGATFFALIVCIQIVGKIPTP